MPTLNGYTLNTIAQVRALTRAQADPIIRANGLPVTDALVARERNDPNFTNGIRRGAGGNPYPMAMWRRRIALHYGLRKTINKTGKKLAKMVKKKQAIKKGDDVRAGLSWDKLYKVARARKREQMRHCVKTGAISAVTGRAQVREVGLKRMTKAQLTAYIKKTNK